MWPFSLFRIGIFLVFSQLSLGPTDWWIGLSIGQDGEEVRCVLYGALEIFAVAAADALRALNIMFLFVDGVIEQR